jgi:hypothetical protein
MLNEEVNQQRPQAMAFGDPKQTVYLLYGVPAF